MQPVWLRDLAKRWYAGACRGIGLGQLRKTVSPLCASRGSRPGWRTRPARTLDRAALEAYLARLAVEIAHPKTRSTDIGAVTGFLHAVRQHRWASLPADVQLYPSDQPRRDQTPAPR